MQLSATVATSTSDRALDPGDPLWAILSPPTEVDSWLWTIADEGFPSVEPVNAIWASSS